MPLAQLWPSWLEALLSSQKSRVWPAKRAPGPPGMAGTSPTAFFGSPGNHSCIPNAETSFPDNNFLLHLTALEDIEAGEVRQTRGGEPGGSLPSPQTPALYLLFVPPRDGSLVGVNFSLTPRSCHLTPRFHEAFGAVLSPALFLFAGRKSASATWTAVRGSGADTAATRYSGRGQPPPTPSQQQQTRKFHLF